MNRWFILLTTFTLPLVAGAAQINGSVFEDGKALPGRKVTVECHNAAGRTENDEAITDAVGRFRLYIRITGSCTLRVDGPGTLTAQVYSYDEPARFDFRVSQGRLERR